jgi:dipeptidyl aminopeptidase/acylaminoacyl peptidase
MHPADVFSADSDGRNVHQLTHLNQALLSQVKVQPSLPVHFKSVDDWTVEGFLTKPLDWQAGKTYPMILMVHGGPNGMWGPNWNLTVQCFASHGWAVLRINPRGSSGYGETFQRGVYREFGGKAYQDLMNGMDAVLAKNPWIDPNRLGVAGHSYGGFMTNWIIGHTTRFKAAVPQSGMTDFIGDDGARDAFYGHARDFGTQFWDDPMVFWKNSPLLYAKDVKTPTLFLQGMVDMRVPEEQAEEYFRALNHFGVPTELVLFPGESHVPGKTPRHVDDWTKWQIYWFERWIDQNPNAVKPNAIP